MMPHLPVKYKQRGPTSSLPYKPPSTALTWSKMTLIFRSNCHHSLPSPPFCSGRSQFQQEKTCWILHDQPRMENQLPILELATTVYSEVGGQGFKPRLPSMCLNMRSVLNSCGWLVYRSGPMVVKSPPQVEEIHKFQNISIFSFFALYIFFSLSTSSLTPSSGKQVNFVLVEWWDPRNWKHNKIFN